MAGRRTCCDVGAESGYYTLFLLHRTETRAVLAFEPDSRARSLLEANLALNAPVPHKSFFLSERFVGVGKESISLDEAVSEREPPYFVKVEIEGGEVDLLLGAERVLAGRATHWVIETPFTETERGCQALLQKHAYQAVVVKSAWWRPMLQERRPLGHNRWLIAIPDRT